LSVLNVRGMSKTDIFNMLSMLFIYERDIDPSNEIYFDRVGDILDGLCGNCAEGHRILPNEIINERK